MKLRGIKLLNYRNLNDIKITFSDDLNYIVGENNIGKTNLLYAINRIFAGKSFEANDFQDSTKAIEIVIRLKLNDIEKGIFDDLTDPENTDYINVRITQENPDEYLRYSHYETGEFVLLSDIRRLLLINYDSLRNPKNELDFSKTKGAGTFLNYIVKKFIENQEEGTTYLNKGAIKRLEKYVDSILKNIEAFNRFNIQPLAEQNNQEMLTRIMVLKDANNVSVSEIGYGVQYNMLIVLSILEKIISHNAENYLEPLIEENAKVKLTLHDTQEQEAINTSALVQSFLKSKEDKVAILIQQRNPNAEIIMKQLEDDSIDYFYGLFSDDDLEYIQYHQKALKILFSVLEQSRSKRVNKTLLNKVCAVLRQNYKNASSKVIQSLLVLTEAFFNKLLAEYLFLENEEKIAYINDTFENRALKQSMDYVDSRVFVSTVHGSKGLEWDYVILPDMEPYLFPNFGSLCGNCDFRTGRINAGDYCRIQIENHAAKDVLEELSVFYVAVTRAQKDVFFSASRKRYNSNGEDKNSKISCLLTMPGIEIS